MEGIPSRRTLIVFILYGLLFGQVFALSAEDMSSVGLDEGESKELTQLMEMLSKTADLSSRAGGGVADSLESLLGNGASTDGELGVDDLEQKVSELEAITSLNSAKLKARGVAVPEPPASSLHGETQGLEKELMSLLATTTRPAPNPNTASLHLDRSKTNSESPDYEHLANGKMNGGKTNELQSLMEELNHLESAMGNSKNAPTNGNSVNPVHATVATNDDSSVKKDTSLSQHLPWEELPPSSSQPSATVSSAAAKTNTNANNAIADNVNTNADTDRFLQRQQSQQSSSNSKPDQASNNRHHHHHEDDDQDADRDEEREDDDNESVEDRDEKDEKKHDSLSHKDSHASDEDDGDDSSHPHFRERKSIRDKFNSALNPREGDDDLARLEHTQHTLEQDAGFAGSHDSVERFTEKTAGDGDDSGVHTDASGKDIVLTKAQLEDIISEAVTRATHGSSSSADNLKSVSPSPVASSPSSSTSTVDTASNDASKTSVTVDIAHPLISSPSTPTTDISHTNLPRAGGNATPAPAGSVPADNINREPAVSLPVATDSDARLREKKHTSEHEHVVPIPADAGNYNAVNKDELTPKRDSSHVASAAPAAPAAPVAPAWGVPNLVDGHLNLPEGELVNPGMARNAEDIASGDSLLAMGRPDAMDIPSVGSYATPTPANSMNMNSMNMNNPPISNNGYLYQNPQAPTAPNYPSFVQRRQQQQQEQQPPMQRFSRFSNGALNPATTTVSQLLQRDEQSFVNPLTDNPEQQPSYNIPAPAQSFPNMAGYSRIPFRGEVGAPGVSLLQLRSSPITSQRVTDTQPQMLQLVDKQISLFPSAPTKISDSAPPLTLKAPMPFMPFGSPEGSDKGPPMPPSPIHAYETDAIFGRRDHEEH